jgi:murein DD-endopeptidase MepM/ murein hydrolase activator NlpD
MVSRHAPPQSSGSQPPARAGRPVGRRIAAHFVLMLLCGGGWAAWGAAYRYKDANGQWVYTDRPPTDGRSAQSVALSGVGAASPKMAVIPRSTPTGVALVAVNECACTAEYVVKAHTSGGDKIGRQVVAAKSEAVLLDIGAEAGPSEVRYEYGFVIGEPNAEHRPSRPYRAPFALAQQFLVTQAPPDTITHRDDSRRNAVDIGMPVGTPVHAAREGIVINVARDHYRGGLDVKDMTEANFVEILHDDGTYAIYAHLQLDTVRVRPGQHVARGEYIANSGNTGFTSGPHLHFVVLRNAGLRSESLPVTFAGPAGSSVAPQSGKVLTAY